MKNYSISEGSICQITVKETNICLSSDERISDAQYDFIKNLEKKYTHGQNSECSFLKEELMKSYVSKSLASKMIEILKDYPIQMRFKTLDNQPYSERRSLDAALEKFYAAYNKRQ